MQLISRIKISLLFIFALISQLAVGQHDCPAYPKRGTFDTLTFIKTEIPTDPTKANAIWLGQGTIIRNGSEVRRAFIPDNRPDHAIAVAHAWNYHRNIVHRVENPPIGYWLATIIQESEYMCEPDAVWSDPNEAPPLYTTNYSAYIGRANTLESGASGTAGCYQIEGPSGSAWFQLGQNYPQGRFPQSQWANLAGGTGTFVSAALVKSYYDVYTKEVYQNQKGWDVYESIDCTLDELAYVKTSASGYNAGINGFGSNAGFFNGSASGNANWTGMAATTGGYADDVAKWTAVFEDMTGYPTYPAGSSFGGYYNEDITWQIVSDYLDIVETMYSEINFATDVTPNVQAAFVEIAGSTGGVIPFQQLGPVIDQIIISLPREYPQIVEGSPTGINPTTCSGNKIPYAGLEILAGPANIKPGCAELCLGESITVQINVEGGGGANPTYRWYKNSDQGTTLSTELIYTITPTAAGLESYGVEVCNDDGCFKIATNSENSCQDPRNANGFWINTTDCSTCSFVASPTHVNTPCKGMNAGSITLTLTNAPTNYQVSYSANTPLGVVTDAFTASGNLVTIPNLRDGSYSFVLEDVNDPTCKAYTSVILGYDTDINEYVDAEITNIANCVADIEANIVELPAPCTWKVWAYVPVYFQWDLQTLASVRTSTGLLSTDVYTRTAPVGELDQYNSVQLYELEFELNTGDEIFFGTSLTTALGSQLRDVTFELYDDQDNMVYNVTSPAGSAQPNSPPIEVGSHTVTCPYSPPNGYDFSWSPALAGETSTSTRSSGTAAVHPVNDITYVVTATNQSNPTCVLTDSVTVPFDASCVPTCSAPTAITITPTDATICEGDDQSYSASVVGTAVLDEYYYTWYDQSNSPITGKTALTSSTSGYDELDLTAILPSQDGTYTLRVEDGNNANAICYLEETFDLTVNAQTTPSVVIEADQTTICENGNINFSITTSDIGTSPTYSWNASSLGNNQNTTDSWPGATGFTNGETVELVVTNIVGCYDATTITSNPITINIDALPSGYSITMPTSACEGETGLTIDIANGNGEATDFTWSFSNATLTSDTTGPNTTQVTVDAENGTLTAIATPVNSCGTQANIVENLVLNQAPVAIIATSDDDLEYCADLNGVNLTAQAVAGATYTWTGPITGGGQTLSNATAGSYQVEVTSSGCSATSTSVTVIEHELPTASISGSEEICDDGSESATLSIDLTGTPNWSIVLNDGSTDLPAVNSASTPYDFTTTLAGAYTATSISDANCTGTTSGNGSISFRTNIDTTNFSINCDVNDDVIISFDLTGGITAGYDVTGISGNLIGTTWTSDPLPELTLHTGSINDGTACHPLSLSVNKSCSCPEEVSLSGDTTICDDGSTTPLTLTFSGGTTYNYDLLLDGNPVQTGLTTTGSSETIQVNDEGIYTITNFIGNCPGSTSGSATVAYHDFPTATISGTTEICDDGSEDAILTIDFSGSPGFTYEITGDGSTGTQRVSNHPTNQAPFNTTSNESFTITSLVDGNGCIARPQDLIGTADVTFRDIPDTTQMTLTCDVNDDYQIELDLSGGDPSSYSVTGASGTLTDADTWLSDPIDENTASTITITDQFACTPLILTTQKLCSCPSFGIISGTNELCINDGTKATIDLSLQGTGPWDVVLNNGTTDTTINGINTSNFSFETTTAGTYSINSITDIACTGSGIGTASVIVHPAPIAVLSGGGPICVGENAPDITVTMTGTTPFSLDLDNAGTNNSFNPNTTTHTINAPAIGTHSVTALQDGNGCVATDLGSPIEIIGQARPSATLSPATVVACVGDPAGPISVNLTTTGPSTLSYTDGTNTFNESVSGNSFDITNLISGNYQLLSLNDGCEALAADISDITSVTIHALPTGEVDPDTGGEICDDGSSTADIAITLEGNGPWSITYTDGTTPTTTSVTTSPFTFSTSNAGSYELTAISDANCSGNPSNEKAIVDLTPIPTTEIIADPQIELCATGSITLSANGENITWFLGPDIVGTGNSFEISELNQSGIYTIQNTGTVCDAELTTSNLVEVTVFILPEVDAGEDQFIFVGENAELIGSSSIGSSLWTPNLSLGDATSTQTLASPTEETVYTLTSTNGPCTSFDDMTVFVQYPVLVPSAFTPNGDGTNEAWNIGGIETYPNAVVLIFNRWGNEVFKSSGYNEPWDGRSKNGKLMPVGTYYYLIDLNAEVLTNGQKASFEGTVTIVR